MDLKIKDVAELLNISESTVRKWLSEGKIPAYRLNRQYRFNRSEIEDWVMRQKLNSFEEKDSAQPTGALQFSLYRGINRGDVLTIGFSKKEDIIAEAMKFMAKRFDLDATVLTELFLDRERLMPTGLGFGIGVPHTRDFLLDTHFDVVLVVYPKTPIDYGALDNEPVHTLFFLFAAEDKNHLHLLSKVAHLSSNEKARSFLKTKPSKESLLDYVKNWETTLNA